MKAFCSREALCWWCLFSIVLLARDSICLACYMLSPVRLSVRPSVTRVDQSPAKVRIMQFSPYSNPTTLVFAGEVSSRNSDRIPWAERQTRLGWGKTNYFLALCVNMSKAVPDSPKLPLTTNRKLHMRFRLAPRSMTLDDLELLQVRIFLNFAWFVETGKKRLNEEDRPIMSATK